MRSTRLNRSFELRSCLLTSLAALVVSASLLTACASKSPEQLFEEARGAYTAELSSFSVEEIPVMPDPVATEDEAGAAEGEAAAGDEIEIENLAPPEVRRNAILDILLTHRASEPLDGVTVDITHADGSGNEKVVYRRYIETAGIPRGSNRQIDILLEDIDYKQGDGFHVEVRHPIPPAERGEYQEYEALD